jgi:signal transduction histidine kinase/ligand-binding sensor domain-containing protein/DNA-binding response OmpR family regulator
MFKRILTTPLVLLLLCCLVAAQPEQMSFMHLDRKSGYSGKSILSIMQDSRNFIWVGTDGGLNRFDGYEFKVFKEDPCNHNAISGSRVASIFEDATGAIWVGTENGLNVYNRKDESFKHYFSVDTIQNSVSYNYITKIICGAKRKIIVGTGGGGLCCYNPYADDFLRPKIINRTEVPLGNFIHQMCLLPDSNILVISDTNNLHIINTVSWQVVYSQKLGFYTSYPVSSLMVDAGNVYLGSKDCFFLFKLADKSYTRIEIPQDFGTAKGYISSFAIDNRGLVWVGTTNDGIFLYEPGQSKIIANINQEELNPYALTGSDISTLFKDKTGKLWVGTWGSGINYYHADIVKFQSFKNLATQPFNLPGNRINVILEDTNANVWIGTETGVSRCFFKDMVLVKDTFMPHSSIENVPILSIFEDNSGSIWAGSFMHGLSRYNSKRNYLDDIPVTKKFTVKNIFEPAKGYLWLCTMRYGIVEYNVANNEIHENIFPDITSKYIVKIVEDKGGCFWVGTAYGLYKIKKGGRVVKQFLSDPENDSSLSDNHIFNLKFDNKGQLLVATPNGLNIYQENKDSFIRLNRFHGLSDDYISSVEVDYQGKIWLSTLNGLSCLELSNDNQLLNIINYTSLDGLQSSEFREGASAMIHTGELVFGGNKGINIFRPDKLKHYSNIQEPIITNLYLFNNELHLYDSIDGRVLLKKAVSETQKIILKHDENEITIAFSALNAVIPDKCMYKYKLEGYEQDWVCVQSNSRKANYTNLDPGEYIFKVYASNADGVWSSSPRALSIEVLPPFWQTKTAKFLLFLVFFILLISLRQLIVTNERHKNQKKLALQESIRQHELDCLKLKFFTNMSHEFRTPLTLIISPLEKMIKELKYKELENPLNIIHRNSKRLLNLVNQLLDFRKMEVSGLKLMVSTGNIVAFIREVISSFSDLAEKKQITFKFRSNINELIMQFDHDKIEKIVFNLLSNAFKYTPENGEITVELGFFEELNLVAGQGTKDEKRAEVQIKVTDNGIGIPREKLPYIFERFVQACASGNIIEHGSGIGLSLVHEFVKIHEGNISAESEEGKGSCFTFSIPVKSWDVERKLIEEVLDVPGIDNISTDHLTDEVPVTGEKKTVLIIEDSEELRLYLFENLQQEYIVFQAPNGSVGLKKAREILPDIIISDIMMPEMDGVELCQNIKSDPVTLHIPVILLTAKTSREEELAGYGSGADAFLTKPFSFEVLEMRIKKLIEQRNKLRQLFNKKIEISPSEISVTSIDEKLIQKALTVVEENMSNPDFSVEQLGRELGMSRVHLYKKILSLTGKPPIGFIRILKMKRAAQLLRCSQLRVSEIAYQVGFNNPKYFSKYFKDEFDMLPSDYARKYKAENHLKES